MQLARAPVIIEAIRGIGILLRLQQHYPRANGVHCAGVHVNHLAGSHSYPIEQLFGALSRDCVSQLLPRHAALESDGDLRVRLGGQHVPAFRLPAGQPGAARGFIIGMHLHRQLFLGKNKFDEQREALGLRRRLSGQLAFELLGELRDALSRQRPVDHLAVITGQPHLAYGLAESAIIKRSERTCAPDSLHELGLQTEWIRVWHQQLSF